MNTLINLTMLSLISQAVKLALENGMKEESELLMRHLLLIGWFTLSMFGIEVCIKEIRNILN